ncbi:DUF481 domain-containing protein [Marinomonas sp. UCMA 3892]|jgi:putative salt-induced outer membrane protein|uniref:DUF481 domain-containing protein n=1 Tax=Marinomonas sp. (strain MWYL1) TaxID=400668 RepID=A6VVL8_MARMS|nr:DUF481 domain-containing protein [Marinomonas sp. UCMA 3892]NLV00911.1 DUF481 domain-containing protein [Marinomonas sp. UCMA 3892]
MEPIKRVVLAALACSVPVIYAADTPFTPLEPLSAELELGVIAITGNTESTAVKAKATIKQDFEAWKAKYQIDTLYKRGKNEGETDTRTTAQKLFLSAQSDYKLSSENTSVFIYGSYTDDRFSGYEYQNTVSVGYSARLFASDSSFLDYSVGPGYSFTKTDKGDEDETAIVHVELQYEYKISPNATFQQALSTEAALQSDKNTRSKSETSVSVKLRDDLSMKAAYSLTHNSQVLDDKKNTDGTTSIIFAYTF